MKHARLFFVDSASSKLVKASVLKVAASSNLVKASVLKVAGPGYIVRSLVR